MGKKRVLVKLLLLSAAGVPALAAAWGDSLYGVVREVSRTDPGRVSFVSDGTRYQVRMVGIFIPVRFRGQAREFVEQLVQGRETRIRIEYQDADEIGARVLTADSIVGIDRDVGVELVDSGLARRTGDLGYKYGELSTAERNARIANRGLWAHR